MKLIITTIALMTLSVPAIADVNQKPTEDHPLQFLAKQTAESTESLGEATTVKDVSSDTTTSSLNTAITNMVAIIDNGVASNITIDNEVASSINDIATDNTLVVDPITNINVGAEEIIDDQNDGIAVKIQEIEHQTDIDVDTKIDEVESLVAQLNVKDDELSNLIQEITSKQLKEKKQAEIVARQQIKASKKQKITKAVMPAKKKSTSSTRKALTRKSRPMLAARKASRNAHSRSKGLCAKYVRIALQSAGYRFTPNASAYQYATRGTLRKAGFSKISNNSRPQIGDIVVISRSRAHPHGHMSIFDGRNWISDFRQRNKNPYKRHYNYTTWRDSRHLNGASVKGLYMAAR